MEQKNENQYDRYLNKLWENFAYKYDLNNESTLKDFFKEKIVESLRNSFITSEYNYKPNNYWCYEDFKNEVLNKLNKEFDNYSSELRNFFNKEKYIELVFHQVYNEIFENQQNKIHLNFLADCKMDVFDIYTNWKIIAERILGPHRGIAFFDEIELFEQQIKEETETKRNGLVLSKEEHIFKEHLIYNNDIIKKIIGFLNKEEKYKQNFIDTNEKWDIKHESNEIEMEYSGDKIFCINDNTLDRDAFIVSNNTRKVYAMYEFGYNKDFDGRILDMKIDIDEYLQKCDIDEKTLLEILDNQTNIMLDNLWDKSSDNNIFDATDKFLKDNGLDDKFVVVSYKGKHFEVIPLYQEKECIYSDYADIVKYEFCEDAKLKEKVIDFLAQQKQNLYDSIKESLEEILKENYNLQNITNETNGVRRM